MTARQKIKLTCFSLEGLNSFATVLYFNYLYFLMRDRFGFDNKHNLALASILGLIYAIAAWQTGKFAQRRGYFNSLKAGFVVMAIGFMLGFAGSHIRSAPAEIIAAAIGTVGMCFIWPPLEALVSDGEDATGLPRVVGIYNVVWAITNAIAYFMGGSLIESFGYGIIFTVPLVMMFGMLGLTFWLQRHAAEMARAALAQMDAAPEPHQPASPRAKAFLRMAWVANPFAYIAIQTLIAVIPGIAAKFHLSTMAAGFICTLWCFVRLGAFAALWRWTGWHYRFRWLITSFAILIASFAAILMSPNLAVLIVAQIFFGGAIGLMYYSSLFYSMDAGDTRGEHGGIHEAAIGLGNCAGPAIGAAALQFLPQYANSGALAVSILLLFGFGGLLAIGKAAK